jgi:hypothetical protein
MCAVETVQSKDGKEFIVQVRKIKTTSKFFYLNVYLDQ